MSTPFIKMLNEMREEEAKLREERNLPAVWVWATVRWPVSLVFGWFWVYIISNFFTCNLFIFIPIIKKKKERERERERAGIFKIDWASILSTHVTHVNSHYTAVKCDFCVKSGASIKLLRNPFLIFFKNLFLLRNYKKGHEIQ